MRLPKNALKSNAHLSRTPFGQGEEGRRKEGEERGGGKEEEEEKGRRKER